MFHHCLLVARDARPFEKIWVKLKFWTCWWKGNLTRVLFLFDAQCCFICATSCEAAHQCTAFFFFCFFFNPSSVTDFPVRQWNRQKQNWCGQRASWNIDHLSLSTLGLWVRADVFACEMRVPLMSSPAVAKGSVSQMLAPSGLALITSTLTTLERPAPSWVMFAGFA